MMVGQCKLCGDECESVVHALWECPVYDSIRKTWHGRGRQSVVGWGGGGGVLKLVHLTLYKP